MSTETKELELCGKVEMRIALAKDDKLESILKLYLAPLLLKLASEHTSVRDKVNSICSHIKIRLAGNQNIILPVATLLKQYKEHQRSPLIREYDLYFIQQSIGKLSSREQTELIPTILAGLSKEPENPSGAHIFNLFLRLLPQLQLPPRGTKEDSDLREKLGLADHSDDAKFFADSAAKLMLLTISRSTSAAAICPGLSTSEYSFLTLNGMQDVWNPSSDKGLDLPLTKINVLNFLSSGAFTDNERFESALFASGDNNSRVSEFGNDMLKRLKVPLEDSNCIRRLLDLYFKLTPVLQTRILVLLTKSVVSTSFPSQIVRIVQEAIQPHDNTNLPAKGLETIKFRNALFNYINWVSRIGEKETLTSIAPQLVELLRNFIEDQGWPIPNEKSSDASSLRALAYETLGSLAKTTPSIVLEKDLRLVRWLFRSLTEENGNISISIEHALSSLLGIFVIPLNTDISAELRHLLFKYMTLQESPPILRSAHFTVARWANHCLEYEDIVGRWIDILAIGGHTDQRSDIVEEGRKGLDPYWYYILNPSTPRQKCFPDWNKTINAFFTSESILECSTAANSLKTGMTIDSVSVFGNFPAFRINAFGPAVTYCRQLLLLDAITKSNIPFVLGEDWEQKIDILFYSDQQSRNVVRNHVKLLDQASINTYLKAAIEGLLWKDGNGLPNCGKCFVDIASVTPSEVIGELSSRAFELLPLIKSNNSTTRFLAAQAYGILASHPSNSKVKFEIIIRSLLGEISPWESAYGSEANKIHGYILALGFLLSRLSYCNQLKILNNSLVHEAVAVLLKILLATKETSIKEAVLNAVAQISVAGVLTISHLDELDIKTAGVIEYLVAAAKKGDEKSIFTLGRLSLIFDVDVDVSPESETYISSILKGLYELFDLKQTEIQFTVGEAISCLSACWDSDVLTIALDVETEYTGRSNRKYILESVLQKLLSDCKTTKPSLKKASGIWLFVLIQHCGHLEEIQLKLRECQAAFMSLLSARDELVQETASRGLSLVYEQGDKSLRENLVKDLVSSFTDSSTKLKVDEDTELFEPGALPTGEGNSVTSYKDIVSLANEVGDQSLIYKFMSLASNAATWSTRAAFGRFGLSSILSESETDPKLYPKLYRYRFDPNPNVRRSMNDIWKALVKDSTVIINLYFTEIITDLLKNILGKEWRTRQASCAALADLVQGREFEKYENYLDEIWRVAFKALDDIKGSVREAAQSLSIALTNILVRQVEAGTTPKHAHSMLKHVLPFLISEQGMESSAQDVRIFATVTVIKLIKSGGKSLLPFVPDLIEKLLGLLSTIEPEEINYLYQRAAEHRDKIDQIRSNAVSRSPLMEAIERCLDLLDEPTMKVLAPRLEVSIKTMIGMPSKIGCAGVLVNLTTRHSFIFRPYADTFLKIIEKAVLDRNNAVSVAFARSTGYLSRLASDEALSRLASFIQTFFFKNGVNETGRQVSGEIVYAIAKFATDRFTSMALDFLPFVFFASHDPDSQVKEQFQKTWDENVAGSRTVILYTNEIIKLSLNHFESPMWTIKHTAALTVADVIESIQLETSGTSAPDLWPALEKALMLKTFDGKEKVLEAFVRFVQLGKSIWGNDSGVAERIKTIAIREAKRNNKNYQVHAFTSLGKICEARDEIDMFEEVYAIIAPTIEKLTNRDRMDTTDNTVEGDGKDNESAILTAGVSCLFRAVNTKLSSSSSLIHLPKLLGLVREVINSVQITVGTRSAIYERVRDLFDCLQRQAVPLEAQHSDLVWQFFALLELSEAFGSESMRLRRAEAGEKVAQVLVGVVGDERISYVCKMRELTELSQISERSPGVKAGLERITKALE
ncbi:Proteasome component [Podosphaera aphanis]|nr:Proteasome component [Podosphaera aphanis]